MEFGGKSPCEMIIGEGVQIIILFVMRYCNCNEKSGKTPNFSDYLMGTMVLRCLQKKTKTDKANDKDTNCKHLRLVFGICGDALAAESGGNEHRKKGDENIVFDVSIQFRKAAKKL